MSLETKLGGGRSGQEQSSSPKPGDKTYKSSNGEQKDGEWYERANHPLLNDLVLPKIFDYVKRNELKSCRLVSRKWNFLSIPFSRSRLKVKITGASSDLKVKNVTSIENFMKLMNTNTLGIPFGRYDLGSFDTTEGFGQQFVQLCGNRTKELILNEDGVHNVESLREMLLSMPKLEYFWMPTHISSKDGGDVELFPDTKPKLNIHTLLFVPRDKAEERRKICPTLNEELLGATPNLSTLQILTYYHHENVTAIEVLEILDKLGRGSSIQDFTLSEMDANILALLRTMASKGMKLKRLSFNVIYIDWLELVTVFKNSLISLGIFFLRTAGTVIFPNMPKLVMLDLTMSESINLSCENFTKTFPALEELSFHYMRESDQLNNFITGDKSSTMKRLIMWHYPHLNMEMFNRILTVFPVLTRLDCNVREEDGVEIIQKIWTHMTQLRGLQIRGDLSSSENVDSLVTGIPIQEIEKMRIPDFFGSLGQTTTKMHRKNILEEMMANIDSERPSIRNLTNLRSLKLCLNAKESGVQRPKYSTELTVYFGLYCLKSLRHLYVYECEFPALCCEIVVKDMDLMTWSFEFNDEPIIPARLNYNEGYVWD